MSDFPFDNSVGRGKWAISRSISRQTRILQPSLRPKCSGADECDVPGIDPGCSALPHCRWARIELTSRRFDLF